MSPLNVHAIMHRHDFFILFDPFKALCVLACVCVNVGVLDKKVKAYPHKKGMVKQISGV